MKDNRRRRRGKARVSPSVLDRINPQAAGIDCGSAEHYVAVPPDRSASPVQLCIPRIWFFLKPLTLPASVDRVFADAIRHRFVALHPARITVRSSCAAASDSRVATSAPGPGTDTPPPRPAHPIRPAALGLAVRRVARMAGGGRHRQARDRSRLASAGLPPALDLEESAPSGPTRGSL
jgi:hypothetical protein